MTLALDAEFEIAGPDGMRTTKADGFFQELFQTGLEPGEITTLTLNGTGFSPTTLVSVDGTYPTVKYISPGHVGIVIHQDRISRQPGYSHRQMQTGLLIAVWTWHRVGLPQHGPWVW